jgi:hypothetical protein
MQNQDKIRKNKHMPQSQEKFEKNKPTKKELIFLNLAYDRFYDIYEKIEDKKNLLNPEDKFSYLINIFQIYSECLRYEPVKFFLKFLEEKQPPSSFIALKYFEVIRHILVHFPFFDKWDDVCFTRDLILWSGKHSKIDSFLLEGEKSDTEHRWRIWDYYKKEMKYDYNIRFPENYSQNSKIYLKDLIDEEKGVEISLLMIKKVFESQVESIKK